MGANASSCTTRDVSGGLSIMVGWMKYPEEFSIEPSRVVQEEAFAPILPVLKWSDEDDVLERANALEIQKSSRLSLQVQLSGFQYQYC
jgi:hypothetical protein